MNPELRPRRHIETLVRMAATVAMTLAIALLAAEISGAAGGRHEVFGVKLPTSVCLVALATATAFVTSRRRVARAGSLIVLALVGVYGIALAPQPANTALLFALLGFGTAMGEHRNAVVRWLADAFVHAAAAVALFAVVASLFQSHLQYPIATRDPMSIVTAVVGGLLATTVILRRADRGVGKLLVSPTTGGVLARRLIPVFLVAPIAIGRLAYLGAEHGLYDVAFATAMGILAGVAIVLGVIVASARVIDRLDTVRRGNEAQIRQMVGDLSRQSRELSRSNKELESFSYSVSHDLRAPIRHIAGFTELLAMAMGDKLDDKTRRYIQMITESAEQAGQLIDDLLEFSRMGRTEMRMGSVSLDEAVRTAWTDLAPERADRNIDLRVGPLPKVHADPAMLQIAVANLLANSVKYTAPREAAVVNVDAREDGDELVLTFRDNGVGFDMKYVDKLFGVFQRLHGEEFEGVGIGLANVKRIIERHGGRAWAEGELDRGASFHISLPRERDVAA